MFLDNDSEYILKQCIDNADTYPAILRNMFSKCDPQQDTRLRAILHALISDGYLSKLQWADDTPYYGRIEQKGMSYFDKKNTYIRAKLRKDSRFNLDDKCEEALSRLCEEYKKQSAPYALISNEFCSEQILQLLNQKELIQFNNQGISYLINGTFTCMYKITYAGETYFSEKERFIEEICLMPESASSTGYRSTETSGMRPKSISKKYDVFISHASKDKLTYTDRLKKSLAKLKINIFYSHDTIDWGDYWKKMILTGVEESEFAIIVISENFFDREWTERELNEFLNRQNKSGERIVLPILHGITLKQLQDKYPDVAAIQTINSKDLSCPEIAFLFASKLIAKLKSTQL